MNTRSSLLASSLFVLTLLLVTAGCGSSDSAPELDISSQPQAPDFSQTTLAGDTFTLSEQRGSVVVVNFWATWCGPCREEIPAFVELQEEYSDQGLQFVGVSLDREGFEVVRPFAKKMNINYPLIVDKKGVLAKEFGDFPALPTTFIIGKQGRIRERVEGMVTKERMLSLVESLLKEKAKPSVASGQTS